MLSLRARLDLNTGNWKEAWNIADDLLKNENQPAITKFSALLVIGKIAMRRGENPLNHFREAKALSFAMAELQRAIPLMVALLEYEWLTGKSIIEETDIEKTSLLMQRAGIDSEKNEFAFWMKKAGRHFTPPKGITLAYDISNAAKAMKAAAFWEKSGCPYEQALVLFEGKDDDKRKAIAMVQDLGATAVYEKMKQEMRNLGIKNIPRGIRNSTRLNAAFLTGREMDILRLLKEELQNKEIAAQLYISAKTVDHHISSILFKLDANSRSKAVTEAVRIGILK
jgi:DNA-binding CsgD family transcriptional regulator